MKLKRLLPLFLSIILLVSSLTMTVGAKTVSTKPKAVLLLNQMNDDNTSRTIKVKWNRMKNIKSYEIQRSRYKNFKKLASGITTTKTYRTYSLKSKNNFDNNYYIRVRAKYKNGNKTKWSNTITATGINIATEPEEDNKPQEDKLKAPVPCLTKNERTSKKCTIRIEWDAIEGAKNYEVQRSAYSDFREHEDTVSKKTTNTYYECTASNSGALPMYGPAKQTWYLRVRSISSDDRTSDWSGVVTAKGEWSLE